jgi:hypothetical protein
VRVLPTSSEICSYRGILHLSCIKVSSIPKVYVVQQKSYPSARFAAGKPCDGLGTDRFLVSPQGRNTIYPACNPGATAILSMHFTNTSELLALPPWPSQATSTGCPRLATETRTAEPMNNTGEDFRGGLQLLQTLPENTAAFRALQSMIFLASNNLLNSARYGFDQDITNWLGEKKNAPLLRRLLSVGGPTAESTLNALYPYALDGGSTDIIKIFINLGCDTNLSYNDSPYSYSSTSLTALGIACARRNLELVSLLLVAGADPNKPSRHKNLDYDEDDLHCPMVISLMGSAPEYSMLGASQESEAETVLQIVKTLMQSGALVHGPYLCMAFHWLRQFDMVTKV